MVLRALQLKCGDWFESLTSLGDHFSKRMPGGNIVRERNERGFHLS